MSTTYFHKPRYKIDLLTKVYNNRIFVQKLDAIAKNGRWICVLRVIGGRECLEVTLLLEIITNISLQLVVM